MAYSLLGAYTDITYANTINIGKDAWDCASNTQKDNALVQGRYYIDSHYTCVEDDTIDVTDLDTVPLEYQTANALIAVEYLEGTLYSSDPLGDQAIVKKRAKAGSVESETVYSGFMQGIVKKGDKYPQVTALLSVYCTIGRSAQLTRV